MRWAKRSCVFVQAKSAAQPKIAQPCTLLIRDPSSRIRNKPDSAGTRHAPFGASKINEEERQAKNMNHFSRISSFLPGHRRLDSRRDGCGDNARRTSRPHRDRAAALSDNYPLGPDSLRQPGVPTGQTFKFTLSDSKSFLAPNGPSRCTSLPDTRG